MTSSKSAWEKFGKEAPHYYILSHDINYQSEEGLKTFYETGEKFTLDSLERINITSKQDSKALEIGAGIGRLSLPHSNFFKTISAVDLSEPMLEQLRANCEERSIPNITTYLPQDSWDNNQYGYVYSYLVFQHINQWSIIVDYITRISKCMNKNAIAQLQFDTRNKSLFYKLRNITPEFILPRSMKLGIRRTRRSTKELMKLFKASGLHILKEFHPDSEEHTFVLRKQ